MKFQVFSDLHVDVSAPPPIRIADDIDAVIAAGDTCEGAVNAFRALRRIVPDVTPIVMVLGNHEFYRRCMPEEIELARAQAPNFNIHLLENDTVTLGGVRVAGCTLWTDYRLFGPDNVPAAMNAARHGLNDHRLITWSKQPWERFRPEEALRTHMRSREFLTDVVAAPSPAPLVLVTHHAIHWNSVQRRYQSDVLSAAFASDLGDLLTSRPTDPGTASEADQPSPTGPETLASSDSRPSMFAIHGHVHNSCDYEIGHCRVIANPHGYFDENPQFNPSLVVEIGP